MEIKQCTLKPLMVKEEITREITKYFGIKIKTAYQNLWMKLKQWPEGNLQL